MGIATRKIVIIGSGHVGSHAGYSIISQEIVEELVFIDTDKQKAMAQAMDLSDATAYLGSKTVVRSGDYSDISDSQMIILAVGPLPDMNKNQTRMDTLADTIKIMRDVIANIKKESFDGIIVSISNPADVIAYFVQKQLDLPSQHVISTSTTLDTARLKRVLSTSFNVDQRSILAYVLGEHGESQMVPWSQVKIGGKSIRHILQGSPKIAKLVDLSKIAIEAKLGGWNILEGKGSTEFGIGASIAEVVRAIFRNEHRVLPVSTLLSGEYGVFDVYASVPCVLGSHGVEKIIQLDLSEVEKNDFKASCTYIKDNIRLALNL